VKERSGENTATSQSDSRANAQRAKKEHPMAPDVIGMQGNEVQRATDCHNFELALPTRDRIEVSL
jgi:hypothetical protein